MYAWPLLAPRRLGAAVAVVAALLVSGCPGLLAQLGTRAAPGSTPGREPAASTPALAEATATPGPPPPTATAEPISPTATPQADTSPTPGATPIAYLIASDSLIVTALGTGLTSGATSSGDPAGIGDGGPPLLAHVQRPTGVAVARDGALFVLDRSHDRVRMLSQGVVTTLAGGGTLLATDAAIVSTQATLSAGNFPRSLAVNPAGDVLIVDGRGALVAFARTAGSRYGISLAPGTAVALYVPTATPSPVPVALAAAPDGGLVVADSANRVIWEFDPSGQFKVLAGTGESATATGSAAGDGGPAVWAPLGGVSRLAVDGAGNVYFSETSPFHRVRMVCRAAGTYFGQEMLPGNVHAIAGSGARTTPTGSPDVGDEGQASNPAGHALAATFFNPGAIAVDPAGHVFVLDVTNQRVRRIDRRTGTIATVVGKGVRTSASAPLGDGGPAGLATLNFATDLTFDRDGNLLVADTENHRIRQVTPQP